MTNERNHKSNNNNKRWGLRATAAVVAAGLLATAAGVGGMQMHHRSDENPKAGVKSGDQKATRGPDQGTQTQTPKGMPPEDQQAKRHHPASGDQQSPPTPKKYDEEETENGEGSNATSSKPLVYKNGPIQTTPRIYLVLWGSSWGTSNGDPYGVANRLHYFYKALGGSTFNNVLKQYRGTTGTFTNATGQYMGWIKDTSTVPARPTQQDMANAAARAAVKMNDINYNAQYVIATPWGVMDQYSTGHRFCGWHNWTAVNGYNGWATYTSLPYSPYMNTASGYGCGQNKVNGSNGILDGVTIIAGHEYHETVNDPSFSGWIDADGQENGDKCAWVNLANMKMSDGSVFPVQPSWSNSYRASYGNGCLYSS